MPKKYTDKELIAMLKQDGGKAVELIFQRYYRYLCQAVYKILPDASMVEDLTQEVFFELWRKREQITINISLKAYLRRAAVNKTLNYLRDQKIRFEEETRKGDLRSLYAGTAQQLEAKELEQIIDAAIDQLPHRCRLVFILSRFEDMTYQEIADKLGISIKTVENQISKALKLLREALGPYL